MKVKEYTLLVKGVFGRNRTVKFKSFSLAEAPEPLLAEAVAVLARVTVNKINLRVGGFTRVIERDVDIEKDSWGTSRTFMLFGEKVIQDWRKHE